ncbi:hypothetical protein HMPREF1982_03162 [Clostridiales bacterium oral taxon 876 str. F0540]|nr:hypothetical protein HMPREF1982_03162 [Clostridiales bacterium oral taxon 876 str. F0540]
MTYILVTKEIIFMKKTYLALTLILSTQLLFAGCSEINNAKDKLNSQTAKNQTSQQTKQDDSKAKTEDTAKDTASDTASDAASDSTDKDNTAADSNTANTGSTDKTDSASANNSGTNSSKTVKPANLTKKDVQTYASMTKTNLIKTFGKDYKSDGTALVFSNGLAISGLDKSDSKPTSIKCKNDVTIMGIKNGMTFDKVQAVLGKTEVIQTYLGTKSNIVYKVQYPYGQGVIKVISPNKDGKNSYIQIVPQ